MLLLSLRSSIHSALPVLEAVCRFPLLLVHNLYVVDHEERKDGELQDVREKEEEEGDGEVPAIGEHGLDPEYHPKG